MYEWYDPPILSKLMLNGIAVWKFHGDWCRAVDLELRQDAGRQIEEAVEKAGEILVIEMPDKSTDSWGEDMITSLLGNLLHKGVFLRLVADEQRHSAIIHKFFTRETAKTSTEVFKTLSEAMPGRHHGLVLTFLASSAPVWIAHSLDFDLMSEGEDEEDALKTLRWVVRTAARDDRRRGSDLFARAPVGLEELLKHLTDHRNDDTLGLQRVEFTF